MYSWTATSETPFTLYNVSRILSIHITTFNENSTSFKLISIFMSHFLNVLNAGCLDSKHVTSAAQLKSGTKQCVKR